MKNSIRPLTFLNWVFIFLPLVITLILLPQMPSQIPAHFGISGMVDRWGSKYETLLMPITTIIVCGVFFLIAQFAFASEKYRVNGKILKAASFSMTVVFSVLSYYFLFVSFNTVTDISKTDFYPLASLSTSLMIAFLGNLFPKCKQNTLVGIRTKWTLESEEVWYQTHRFGGKLWFYGGLLLAVVCGLFVKGIVSLAIVFSGIFLSTIILVLYSYVCYKGLPLKNTK